MTFLEILTFIAAIVIPFGILPQAYKIFKDKTAKEISIVTFSVLFVGMIIFLLYSIEINNLIYIITYALSVLAYGLILVGWFLYK